MNFTDLEVRKIKNDCKGLVFRGYSQVYSSKSGYFEHKQGFRLLKRKSCKGCPNCGGLLEYANEALCDGQCLHDDIIEDGSIYSLTCYGDGEFQFSEIKKER